MYFKNTSKLYFFNTVKKWHLMGYGGDKLPDIIIKLFQCYINIIELGTFVKNCRHANMCKYTVHSIKIIYANNNVCVTFVCI